MTQLIRRQGLLISPSALLPKGTMLLWNQGRPVIAVPIGAPIEDAECDHIMFHPDDYDDIEKETRELKRETPPNGFP